MLPITYMGVLDGRMYGAAGLARMYLVDGGLSLAACAVLALVMWKLGLGRRLGEEPTLEVKI